MKVYVLILSIAALLSSCAHAVGYLYIENKRPAGKSMEVWFAERDSDPKDWSWVNLESGQYVKSKAPISDIGCIILVRSPRGFMWWPLQKNMKEVFQNHNQDALVRIYDKKGWTTPWDYEIITPFTKTVVLKELGKSIIRKGGEVAGNVRSSVKTAVDKIKGLCPW